MSEPAAPLDVPALREHEFQSNAPIVGPLIVMLRRTLYSLTAKWPLRVALDQQTRINQQLAQRLLEHEARLREYEAQLHEYEARLIALDTAWVDTQRVQAEAQVQLRAVTQQTDRLRRVKLRESSGRRPFISATTTALRHCGLLCRVAAASGAAR